MKDLKGTKTEQNLLEAFAGESMARNKYTFFASKAKKDGYVQISKIFEETAANEKEHAELWYKYLNGGKISDTTANLADAAAGENAEWTDMYKIIGHTDSVGKDEANQKLSEGRANEVMKDLIERGIAADRIEAEGRGETQPIDTNDTEEGRQNNRRVEIEIL